jgi:hypothetical protein
MSLISLPLVLLASGASHGISLDAPILTMGNGRRRWRVISHSCRASSRARVLRQGIR